MNIRIFSITFSSIFLLYTIGHVFMSKIFKRGKKAIITLSLIFFITGVSLLLLAFFNNQVFYSSLLSLYSAFFFWAVIGESLAKLEIIEITDKKYFGYLLLFIVFCIFLINNKFNVIITIPFIHFTSIWFLHFVIGNEFRYKGKKSLWVKITFLISFFLLLTFLFLSFSAKELFPLVLFSLFSVQLLWMNLEILWALELLKKWY
ncbi:MAG: hypothetical protein AB1410_01550 [Acidobacteriota bacterium]